MTAPHDAPHSTSTRNPDIYGNGLMDGRGAMPVPALGARGPDGVVGNGIGIGSSGERPYAGVPGVAADPGNGGETRRRSEYYHSTPVFSSHSRPWEMNDPNSNTVPRLATNSHSARHLDRDSVHHQQQQQHQHQQRDHQDVQSSRPRDNYDRGDMFDSRDRHQDYLDSPRYGPAQTSLSHSNQAVYGSSLTPSYQQSPSHPHQPGHPSNQTPMPPSYNPVSPLNKRNRDHGQKSAMRQPHQWYSRADVMTGFTFLCSAYALCK